MSDVQTECFSLQELLDQWEIKEHELLRYLGERYQPYSKHCLTPIPCPRKYHEGNKKLKELGEIGSRLHDLLKIKKDISFERPISILSNSDLYDYLRHVDPSSFQPDQGRISISSIDQVERLKALKAEAEDEYPRIDDEPGEIVGDKPSVESWKYFIKPKTDKE